jgi:hypothetical protein
MSSQFPEDLIYAAFFFIDIVGLSNPVLSTETQRTKVRILNESIYDCQSFREYPKENVLILPTGDGMLICFKNGLEEPIKLAKEFHEKLAKYNQQVSSVEKIETRIGCNIGHVFVVKDIYGNINLWGPGAILARRVMDLGNSGHILLSDEYANDLMEISDDYNKILNPLQNFGIKHGDTLLIYSAFGNGFGNSSTPELKTPVNTESDKLDKIAKCEKIIFNVILKEMEIPTIFERYYYFSNNLSEPLNQIIVGITANSEEEFHSLHLKICDEKEKELSISKILSPTPLFKKIIVKLDPPIFPGDKGKYIKLTYESKLSKNSFENFFLEDAQNFELNLSHYSNLKFNPSLFHFDIKHVSKNLIDSSSKITKGVFVNHKWEKTNGIHDKDLIHLDW